MQQAIHHFQIMHQPVFCRPFGHGNINYTFLITTDDGKQYILQRINTHVFKQPVQLMENVIAVTQHIRSKVDDPSKVLNFIPALDGKYYYRDERRRYWRCYEFVGGFCLEAPESDADFYESAVAFGRFQEQLSDFPAETLHETIPNFHNTPDRYRQLHIAMDEDACDRLQFVQPEIDFILEREQEAGTIQRMLESGELPLRVTHNDTKLNNVLLDMKTRKALCVLDLDTVMPGSSLFDFGDSIRFGAATAPEDVQELSRMTLDLHRFEVYTKGFLDGCHSLTKREIELLPLGAKIITLELAVRFLTDYLESDHYFKTQYSDHNLVRCRAQLKLVRDMEAKWYHMDKIVKNYLER
ncbi:MAG: aminoglycoside phosphotransferase family protein [Oscillospiraceae bacterium]|nr:aminoglycoside phosphotransferase family protein [Oscillospiraceae bacterium]